MHRKNKQTLAFITIVILLMQIVFSSLPVIAISPASPLQISMTTNGKPYIEGDIATSPVAIQVSTTSQDSATVEFSQDGETWGFFDVAKQFIVEDIGEHSLWFRLKGSNELQKYTIRIAQPMLQTMANGLNIVTHYPEADVMSIEGSTNSDGVYNNDSNGKVYVGMTNEAPAFQNTRNRSAFRFKLDENKKVVAATLDLYVASVDGVNSGHPLYVDVYGSPNNNLSNADGPLSAFPTIETGAVSVRHIAPTDLNGMPVVPSGGRITMDVTALVKAYTDNIDRDITLVAVGNESNPLNGRFSIYSAEFQSEGARPKLTVTYSDNQPPTGTLSVREGAYTNNSTVTLDITASDPDVGDSVTAMRFTQDLANWPSVWESYASVKSFRLSAGDGKKTIYMQLKDNSGAISASYNTTVILDTTPPVVSGVINGGLYKDRVAFIYDEGTATLNGSPIIMPYLVTAEGDYTLVVTDSAGNTTTVSFKVDWTPPDGEFTINSGNQWTNNTNVLLTLSGMSSDTHAVQVSNSLNGFDNNSGWLPKAATIDWQLTPGDGEKTVYVRFKDRAGNISGIVSQSIKLLTATPTGKVTINNGALWTTETDVELAFDNLSDHITEFQVSNINGDWSTMIWTPIVPVYDWNLAAGDGTKTVYARFRDKAGNISNVISTAIQLDTEAPTGSFTINEGNEWTTNTAVTLTFDGISPDAEAMQVSNDQTTWPSSWENITSTYNWQLTSGDGVKTVYIRFKDGVGNISNVINQTIKLDTEAPTGSFTINEGDEWTTNKAVTLTFAGISPDAKAMQISNKANIWPSTWENVAPTYNWNLEVGDGTKTVYVRFQDKAGNIGNVISAEIKLDTEAPTGNFTINSGDEWAKDKHVTLTFMGISSDTKEMQVSNEVDAWPSTWEIIKSSYNWNLSPNDGVKTVYVRFRDGAGNIGNPVSATIKLDMEAPTGSFIINGGDEWTKDKNVKLLFKGISPDAEAMQISNEADAWLSTWESITSTYNWNLATGDGMKTVYVRFRDRAGNIGNAISATIKLDTTLPTGGNTTSPSRNTDSSSPPILKITLHANGGTELASIEITYNTKISDLPIPTRAGYRFDGWYEDKALTKPWAETTLVKESMSLYAKWTALPVEEPEIPQKSTLNDVEQHWAKEMIEELVTRGIIQGYEDGTFRPNESISRMHVAVLLTRAFSLEAVRETEDFTDVPTTHRYYAAIKALQQAGIVDGANGAFQPAENMTREQMAKVLVGVLGLKPAGTSSFTDVNNKHWSAGYIAVLEREGIALGDNGNFRPKEAVTRAQFVAFLYRIMQK